MAYKESVGMVKRDYSQDVCQHKMPVVNDTLSPSCAERGKEDWQASSLRYSCWQEADNKHARGTLPQCEDKTYGATLACFESHPMHLLLFHLSNSKKERTLGIYCQRLQLSQSLSTFLEYGLIQFHMDNSIAQFKVVPYMSIELQINIYISNYN